MADSDFVVRIEGVELPPAVRKQIASEIQSVVLRHLASVDYKGDLAAHIPHREWYGLWLRSEKLPGGSPLTVNQMQAGR